MTALTAGATHTGTTSDPGLRGPSRTMDGPPAPDRSVAGSRPGRTVRSWPLLVLAAPAAAEVWSGWVGIAHETGFGLVPLLPGIWPSLHLDTAITLPVGVEAYAAYALRAWLASEDKVSDRTRRFAKWSAVCSFTLGMAGQVAYHLLAQAGVTRAPWPITTIVSCLPVLVLGMGTALAHMLRADAAAGNTPGCQAGPAVDDRSPTRTCADQTGPAQGPPTDHRTRTTPSPPGSPATALCWDTSPAMGTVQGTPPTRETQTDQARVVARRLATEGKPASRRALRSFGIKGSNEALNALARKPNAELAADGSSMHVAMPRKQSDQEGQMGRDALLHRQIVVPVRK